MAAENTLGSSSRIVAETKFEGKIDSKSDFRIDGKIEDVSQTSSKLVVGGTGVINSTVICRNVDIEGEVTSTVKISSVLSLKLITAIEDEVHVDKLLIEPEAVFSTACTVKGGKNFTNEKQ